MAHHTLVIHLDSIEQAKLDAGQLVFPEHPDSRTWTLQCPGGDSCIGWTECRRLHICKHGHEILYDDLSFDGPCPGFDDENCIDTDDEQEFHGETHTYRWGSGWTVPYVGCVASECCGGPPDQIDTLPIGEYAVEPDWWDDSACVLDLVVPTTTRESESHLEWRHLLGRLRGQVAEQ